MTRLKSEDSGFYQPLNEVIILNIYAATNQLNLAYLILALAQNQIYADIYSCVLSLEKRYAKDLDRVAEAWKSDRGGTSAPRLQKILTQVKTQLDFCQGLPPSQAAADMSQYLSGEAFQEILAEVGIEHSETFCLSLMLAILHDNYVLYGMSYENAM